MKRYMDKFLVLKTSDIADYISVQGKENLSEICDEVARCRKADGRAEKSYVVVASDWPMYETVWGLIEPFVDGKPNEIESLRAQLATSKLEGFNEGIEAAANAVKYCTGSGSLGKAMIKEIRALKREVKR